MWKNAVGTSNPTLSLIYKYGFPQTTEKVMIKLVYEYMQKISKDRKYNYYKCLKTNLVCYCLILYKYVRWFSQVRWTHIIGIPRPMVYYTSLRPLLYTVICKHQNNYLGDDMYVLDWPEFFNTIPRIFLINRFENYVRGHISFSFNIIITRTSPVFSYISCWAWIVL